MQSDGMNYIYKSFTNKISFLVAFFLLSLVPVSPVFAAITSDFGKRDVTSATSATNDSSQVIPVSVKPQQLQPTTDFNQCTYSSSGDAEIRGTDSRYTSRIRETGTCPEGYAAVQNKQSIIVNEFILTEPAYRDAIRGMGVAVGIRCCKIVNQWVNSPP